MNKILTVGGIALLALASSYRMAAQSESTALDISAQQEARGSARYQALSGAMGAVGADFSSVHQNPAGIAYFRSGARLSTTLTYSRYNSSNDWLGTSSEAKGRGRLHFDQLSYLSGNTTDSGITITWGLGVQNNGRFRRLTDALTTNAKASLSDYAAATTNNLLPVPATGALSGSNAFDNQPWISVLGYEAGWMDGKTAPGGGPYYESAFFNTTTPRIEAASLLTDERGSMSNFDFAVAAEFSPVFSAGLNLSLTSLNYEYRSYYQENWGARTAQGDYYGLSLDNSIDISGMGARLGVGVLFQPTDGLRLGASIFTPTLMANLDMDFASRATGVSPSFPTKSFDVKSPVGGTSFGITTPWRFGLSGAYVFGKRALLSVDYEYQDYGGARLRESAYDDTFYLGGSTKPFKTDNEAISDDLGDVHTLRLGFECNISNRLVGRLGYRLTTKLSYTADLDTEEAKLGMMVPGASVHYRLPGAVQGFSAGLGIRLSKRWTLDLAYAFRQQKDRVGAFPFVRDETTMPTTPYVPNAYIHDTQRQHNFSATISARI